MNKIIIFILGISLSSCVLRRVAEEEEKSFMCGGSNIHSPLLPSVFFPKVENEPVLQSTTRADSSIANLPKEYKESMDWIWTNRIIKEGSTTRQNLIFDQIVAGKGELHYVVRWQSDTPLPKATRAKFQPFIEKQINSWTDWLIGFEGWPYEHVDVKVVGWAVCDESLIKDKQSDETVYTSCTKDDLHNDNSAIPAELPNAPAESSRFEHFTQKNYKYAEPRWDMYLWGTTGFGGGAGGDWGQRVSDSYILSVLDAKNGHIIQHEMGHGFGMTDFYEPEQCPKWPEGSSNIMVAGWASEVTDYDGWMLRYIWDKIRGEEGRFDL